MARVEHVQLIPSRVHNHEGEKYRLVTKLPLIGWSQLIENFNEMIDIAI